MTTSSIHRSARLALAGLLAAAPGCAPRVSGLLEHKHYREAICAAHDGGARRRALVSESLARDTAIYLHVERLEASEVAAIVGSEATAAAVLERVQLVRVRARTNALPIEDLGLDLSIQGDRMGAAAGPLGWETLAFATGETPPGPRQTESYATLGNVLRAAGAVVTLGFSLPFTRWSKRIVETAAPLEAYEQQMPVAATLMHALWPASCKGGGISTSEDGAGLSCLGHFVFDRSPEARWTLALDAMYLVGSGLPGAPACIHRRVSAVEIGRVDEWGERFGPRMRRIDELDGEVVETKWERIDP